MREARTIAALAASPPLRSRGDERMSGDLFSFAAERSPSPETIEAAARAHYEFQQGCVNGTFTPAGLMRRDCCPPWQDIHPLNQEHYRLAARAALSVVFPQIVRPCPYAFMRSICAEAIEPKQLSLLADHPHREPD